MKKEYNFFVNGEWRNSNFKYELINPFNDKLITVINRATKDDIEDAIIAAEKAFLVTKKYSSYEKEQILEKIITGIKDREDELAEIISLEAGKCIKHAQAEVKRSIVTFTLAKEEVKRIGGEILQMDFLQANKNRFGIVRKFPVGPISGISPFNFPLNLVAHKVAPAIAVGNPIILKPASQTPLSALILAEIIENSGLEKGAFSVVTSSASESSKLIEDSRIKKLTFTGSPEVGWNMKKLCGKKKITLELGGNSGVIIDKSFNSIELDKIVQKCVVGAFAYQGQVCIHLQRIYIHEDIYDIFKEKFILATKKLKLGNPIDQDVNIGPMINNAELNRVHKLVTDAENNKAIILLGGKQSSEYKSIYEPTIIENCKKNLSVNSEEIFGPVVILHKFTDINLAIDDINDSKFGLQAGIFTNDFRAILRAYETIDAGGIVINDTPTFRVDNQPYGGQKDSGFGREGVKFAMDEMSDIKILSINPEI